MQVILTDDVYPLGRRGQIVKVADGYARNFLIPKRLAVPATAGNLKMVEQQRVAMAKREATLKEDAEILAGELAKLHVLVSRKAGDGGALFGSVTSKDLAELLEGSGVHIDRRKLLLEHPVKRIGNFSIPCRLHAEVSVELFVTVLPEADEEVAVVRERNAESERFAADVEQRLQELGETAADEEVES